MGSVSCPPPIPRAWFSASLPEFLSTEPDAVIGALVSHSDFAVIPGQRDAWLQEIQILRNSLAGLDGALLLEFSIPRMGRRIDAVVIAGAVVIAIEFNTWDGDLRFNGSGWSYHDFRGSRWTSINSPENRNYLRNAYRVLLTRARQGMVIFVPPGDSGDGTRSPEYYDSTFDFLSDVGIPVIGR